MSVGIHIQIIATEQVAMYAVRLSALWMDVIATACSQITFVSDECVTVLAMGLNSVMRFRCI
jgi:hypothetical protein